MSTSSGARRPNSTRTTGSPPMADTAAKKDPPRCARSKTIGARTIPHRRPLLRRYSSASRLLRTYSYDTPAGL